MNAGAREAAAMRRSVDVKAFWIGVGAGVTAILCCVSPVVLFLVGISTATEAITLGYRLYYGYAWYFRGVGLAIAIVATVIYLRAAAAARCGAPLPAGGPCWASWS